MAPCPYRRWQVPRHPSPQVIFPTLSGDSTAPSFSSQTATALLTDPQAPSGAPGLTPPTLTLISTPMATSTPSTSAAPTPAKSNSPQNLHALAIAISVPVGLFVLSAVIMAIVMVRRNNKKTAIRERQAKYTAWSRRDRERKHQPISPDYSTSSEFDTRATSLSPPSPVLLNMRVPSPAIPNPFVRSPISPDFPRSDHALRSPKQHSNLYPHTQVSTGMPRFVVQIPKVNTPRQRVMSMAVSSESSEHGDASLAGLDSVVEVTNGFKRTEPVKSHYASIDTPESEYPPSIKSFVEPSIATDVSHPTSLRPLSFSRKPVPSMPPVVNVAPATPTPSTGRATVSTFTSYPVPVSPTAASTSVPTQTPTLSLHRIDQSSNGLDLRAPPRASKSIRARERHAMQALIDALDTDVTPSRRMSTTSSRRTSWRTLNSKLSRYVVMGQATSPSRPISITSSSDENRYGLGVGMRVADNGNGDRQFAASIPDAATRDLLLSPTVNRTFSSQIETQNQIRAQPKGTKSFSILPPAKTSGRRLRPFEE